jgi:hypothetical protein
VIPRYTLDSAELHWIYFLLSIIDGLEERENARLAVGQSISGNERQLLQLKSGNDLGSMHSVAFRLTFLRNRRPVPYIIIIYSVSSTFHCSIIRETSRRYQGYLFRGISFTPESAPSPEYRSSLQSETCLSRPQQTLRGSVTSFLSSTSRFNKYWPIDSLFSIN